MLRLCSKTVLLSVLLVFSNWSYALDSAELKNTIESLQVNKEDCSFQKISYLKRENFRLFNKENKISNNVYIAQLKKLTEHKLQCRRANQLK